MKQKIYIVTSGSYSEYHIDGVFTDLKLAKDFQKANNCDFLETHIADTNWKREQSLWHICLYLENQEAVYADKLSLDDSDNKYIDCFSVYQSSLSNSHQLQIDLIIKADGYDTALKIAHERIGQIKAFSYMYPEMMNFDTNGNAPWYNYKTKQIVK